MSETKLGPIEDRCRAIVSEGDGVFRWVWDDQYDAVLSTVKGRAVGQARALAEKHFPFQWDMRSVETAPELVKRVSRLLGGLSQGQALFTTETDANALMLGVWWPWSDGDTCSFRVGLVALKPEVSQSEIDEEMKRWFGW